ALRFRRPCFDRANAVPPDMLVGPSVRPARWSGSRRNVYRRDYTPSPGGRASPNGPGPNPSRRRSGGPDSTGGPGGAGGVGDVAREGTRAEGLTEHAPIRGLIGACSV